VLREDFIEPLAFSPGKVAEALDIDRVNATAGLSKKIGERERQ